MTCVICRRKARLVALPLVGRSLWLCRVHAPAQMVSVMRQLVAHG